MRLTKLVLGQTHPKILRLPGLCSGANVRVIVVDVAINMEQRVNWASSPGIGDEVFGRRLHRHNDLHKLALPVCGAAADGRFGRGRHERWVRRWGWLGFWRLFWARYRMLERMRR